LWRRSNCNYRTSATTRAKLQLTAPSNKDLEEFPSTTILHRSMVLFDRSGGREVDSHIPDVMEFIAVSPRGMRTPLDGGAGCDIDYPLFDRKRSTLLKR
jgi:hypothetical protein